MVVGDCGWFEEGRGGRKGNWGAYASAVGAIALVAERAFTHDAAVGVGGFVGSDVAGAAAAVGDDGVGHGGGVLLRE